MITMVMLACWMIEKAHSHTVLVVYMNYEPEKKGW